MDEKELDNIINYNNHAITMSKIAIALLSDNYIIGKPIRALIAMYMLIPYITRQQLDKPSDKYNIPKLDLNSLFAKVKNYDGSTLEMTLDGLRNAICHSFVCLTEDGDLMLDDRASLDRKTHNSLINKDFYNRLELEKTINRLLELHQEVIKQQEEYNKSLLKKIRTIETQVNIKKEPHSET